MRFSRRRDGSHAGLGGANGQQSELRCGAGQKAGGTPTVQDQTHHGNMESTPGCVQGSANGDRQGYRDPLGGVCGGARDTSPTPRHGRLVKTPENDGGPGREEN